MTNHHGMHQQHNYENIYLHIICWKHMPIDNLRQCGSSWLTRISSSWKLLPQFFCSHRCLPKCLCFATNPSHHRRTVLYPTACASPPIHLITVLESFFLRTVWSPTVLISKHISANLSTTAMTSITFSSNHKSFATSSIYIYIYIYDLFFESHTAALYLSQSSADKLSPTFADRSYTSLIWLNPLFAPYFCPHPYIHPLNSLNITLLLRSVIWI